MQYGLEVYCPVDAAGRFYRAEGAAGRLPDELIGKTVWEANPIVVEILKAHGALLGLEKMGHSYPHCWRCHNPMIFRATEQWFIGMERNDLRQERAGSHQARAVEAYVGRRAHLQHDRDAAGLVHLAPARVGRADHRVLLRQVPRAAHGSQDPGSASWNSFASTARTSGTNARRRNCCPRALRCAKCGCTEFSKESDILDVWFDSGSSHLAVLNERFGLAWPADMYIEGGDQYRGWFHSSLLVGTGLKGGSPYRACALSGWVLDGEGKAMRKSLGNSIEPEEVIKHHGAEILRLWSASVDFSEDVRLSETIQTRLTDAYRKLRNTFRYMLGNFTGFDPATDLVPAEELPELDQWILLRAEDLVAKCRAWYRTFEFHKVYHTTYAFATVDLSAVYFDVVKDRLYTSATNSKARRSAQTALYRLLDALVRLLAPLMSFTAEEVWGHMGREGTVHAAFFPEPDELSAGIAEPARKRLANWDRLMEVRGDVLKSLETARNEKLIGAPLEARVRLSANGDLYPLLQQHAGELPGLFIVSQVDLEPGQGDALSIQVERAEGTKCERCWKYTTDVGSDPRFPTICGSCAGAVDETLNG